MGANQPHQNILRKMTTKVNLIKFVKCANSSLPQQTLAILTCNTVYRYTCLAYLVLMLSVFFTFYINTNCIYVVHFCSNSLAVTRGRAKRCTLENYGVLCRLGRSLGAHLQNRGYLPSMEIRKFCCPQFRNSVDLLGILKAVNSVVL